MLQVAWTPFMSELALSRMERTCWMWQEPPRAPFPLFLGWNPKIPIFRHMQVILLDIVGYYLITSYFYPPSSDIPLYYYYPYWNSSSSDQPIRLWIVLCTIIVYRGYILSLYNYKMYIYVLIIPILETHPGYTWDGHIKKTEHPFGLARWRKVSGPYRKQMKPISVSACLSGTEPWLSGWVLLES